jgi:hypothetical protein
MDSALQATDMEIFRIIGISDADLEKIDNSDWIWSVYPFETGAERPVAAFSEFASAFKLACRLNHFVESGMGIRAVLRSDTNIEVDRYHQLIEVGMTPFLIRLKSQGGDLEVIDGVSNNLDEISLENNISELLTNLKFRRRIGWEFDLVGTFWAPSRRLAIKKARTFSSMITELQDRVPGLFEKAILSYSQS